MNGQILVFANGWISTVLPDFIGFHTGFFVGGNSARGNILGLVTPTFMETTPTLTALVGQTRL